MNTLGNATIQPPFPLSFNVPHIKKRRDTNVAAVKLLFHLFIHSYIVVGYEKTKENHTTQTERDGTG